MIGLIYVTTEWSFRMVLQYRGSNTVTFFWFFSALMPCSRVLTNILEFKKGMKLLLACTFSLLLRTCERNRNRSKVMLKGNKH